MNDGTERCKFAIQWACEALDGWKHDPRRRQEAVDDVESCVWTLQDLTPTDHSLHVRLLNALVHAWNNEPSDDPHAITRDEPACTAKLDGINLTHEPLALYEYAIVLCTKARLARERGDTEAYLIHLRRVWNKVQQGPNLALQFRVLGLYRDALMAIGEPAVADCILEMENQLHTDDLPQEGTIDQLLWECLQIGIRL